MSSKELGRDERIQKAKELVREKSDISKTKVYEKHIKGTKYGIRKKTFFEETKGVREQKPTQKTRGKPPKPSKKPLSKGQKKGLIKGQINNSKRFENTDYKTITNEVKRSKLDFDGVGDYIKSEVKDRDGGILDSGDGYVMYKYIDENDNEFFIKENKDDPYTLDKLGQLEKLKENDSIANVDLSRLEYVGSYDYVGLNLKDIET